MNRLDKKILRHPLLTVVAFILMPASLWCQDRIYLLFFNEQIQLPVPQVERLELEVYVTDTDVHRFYTRWQFGDHIYLLSALQAQKNRLNLNDWLYYLLIEKSAEALFGEDAFNEKQLFCWFLLQKSGYKVQLNNGMGRLSLAVFSNDRVFNLPCKRQGTGWLVDITRYNEVEYLPVMARERALLQLTKDGGPFSFRLNVMPRFLFSHSTDFEMVQLDFEHKGHPFKIELRVNKSWAQLLHDYPELEVAQHMQFPVSSFASQTLLSSLKNTIKYKNTKQALELLMSFTRDAFSYAPDLSIHGVYNLSFSPEETLYFNVSDCEDRAVLLAWLVEELLDIDAIIVQFDSHVGVAVNLPRAVGKPIVFEKRLYTYLDPTGPDDVLKIGEYPNQLETASYTTAQNGY